MSGQNVLTIEGYQAKVICKSFQEKSFPAEEILQIVCTQYTLHRSSTCSCFKVLSLVVRFPPTSSQFSIVINGVVDPDGFIPDPANTDANTTLVI